MQNKVKFPIRTKLLILLGAFVLMATAAYLAMAIQLFKEDKTQLVYELNVSTVKTLAAETEADFRKIIDKVKLLTQGHRDSNWTQSIFESDPDLVSYTLYGLKSDQQEQKGQWEAIASVRNSEYLKLYNLNTNEMDRIRSQFPIPFEKVLTEKTLVLNSTLPGGAPLFTLAISLELVSEKGSYGQFIAALDLRMDRIINLLKSRKMVTSYLVDSSGRILAHPEMTRISGHESFENVPIVQDALHTPVTLQVKPFEWMGTRWLGTFNSVGIGGVQVISQIEESQVFKATRQLIYKSIFFALIVMTSAIWASSLLAKTFTDPLTRLLETTEKLSRWEFGQSIHVNTRDEIAHLARAFNAMASDLQSQHLQLEANQSELEKKVQERTYDLEMQKKKLAESQDTLIKTTRLASLGELAGMAAHEVLNPVNNMNIRIQKMADQLEKSDKTDARLLQDIVSSWSAAYAKGGWATLQEELQKPSQDPGKTLGREDLENLVGITSDLWARMLERAEDMRFLVQENQRITKIINNMRALSRVGGERRPLDIHLPIEATAMALNDLLQKSQVNLVKDYSADPRDLFSVIGDQDEMVQIFLNLMKNAVHAISSAKRREGILKVETRRSGQRVEVRISDNGTGISSANLARLFEANFTTKTLTEGTGLGLSISRRLVRAFGGDLEVEKTAEGIGTTFLVWFPTTS